MSAIEIFRADDPPNARVYSDYLTAGILQGNMGSLVIIKLGKGEITEHAHEQEHVGVVLEGEFSFTEGDHETVLRAGDLYRIPPNVTHGIRCKDRALICRATTRGNADSRHDSPPRWHGRHRRHVRSRQL